MLQYTVLSVLLRCTAVHSTSGHASLNCSTLYFRSCYAVLMLLIVFPCINCTSPPCDILPGVPVGFVEDSDIEEVNQGYIITNR